MAVGKKKAYLNKNRNLPVAICKQQTETAEMMENLSTAFKLGFTQSYYNSSTFLAD